MAAPQMKIGVPKTPIPGIASKIGCHGSVPSAIAKRMSD